MGSTNKTANIELPQFVDADKPTWRGDINSAFADIDTFAGTTIGEIADRYTKAQDDALLAAKTTPAAAAAAAAALIADQHATDNKTYMAPFNVKSYGAIGDNATDDTTAIAATITAAAAACTTMGVKSVSVYFPHGSYRTNRFTVPGGVSLFGDGMAASRIVNTSTDGLVFVLFAGSNSHTWGLDYDGQRAAQLTTGLATVQFARTAHPSGGGINMSGGVLLTTAPVLGAVSLVIDTDSPDGYPILAGEIITLVEGSNYEMVKITQSYTGGLTLPLEYPISQAFTVAALVSVAVTNVGIHDCFVRGNGRDGIAFWHAIHAYADRNTIIDYEDTGVDCPSGGSRFVHIRSNVMETQGRWGVGFDTADTEFGHVSDCISKDNTIRFLPGGSFVNGNTIDGVYLGAAVRCHSINDIVDLTLAGISGIRYAGNDVDYSKNCHIINPTVIGPVVPRAGTAGVRNTASDGHLKVRVSGGVISHMETGIELYTALTAIVSGVLIEDTSGHSISVTADVVNAQSISVIGVQTAGGVSGIRLGGAPNVGNKATVTGCINLAWSYAAIISDVGWNVVLTGNIP